MRDHALAICGAHASDQREEHKATSIETLRQMVAAGVGCTLLPLLASLPGTGSVQGEMVQIRPFAPPEPVRTIGLVWRRHYPRESTLRMLATMIRDRLAPVVETLVRDDPDDGRGAASYFPAQKIGKDASNNNLNT